MDSFEIQWDKNKLDGKGKIQYIKICSYKYLLKQNQNYYSIKSEFYSNGQFQPLNIDNPMIEDFTNKGFEDLNLLTQEITIGEETFRPIDKLKQINDGKFDIVMKETQ